jgi:DNA-binding XRE family transcriptional regulator
MTTTHHPRATGILCSACEKGHLAEKVVKHDVGPLLGMPHVRVENLPALVCSKCETVTVPGAVLDAVANLLAALILKSPALDAGEVRYLRRMVGDTQEEFAKRLEVERATVNRWENATAPISGPTAYAIRSHVFFRLRGKSATINAVAETFLRMHSADKRSRRNAYRIDASDLVAA